MRRWIATFLGLGGSLVGLVTTSAVGAHVQTAWVLGIVSIIVSIWLVVEAWSVRVPDPNIRTVVIGLSVLAVLLTGWTTVTGFGRVASAVAEQRELERHSKAEEEHARRLWLYDTCVSRESAKYPPRDSKALPSFRQFVEIRERCGSDPRMER